MSEPQWLADGLDRIWLPYAQMKTSPRPAAVRATHGSRIVLEDGRELIDGIASWWTAVHGYNHPHILDAMRRQFDARQKTAKAGRWRWALAGPALCASVLVACVWLLGSAPPGESGATVMGNPGSGFIVLVSADRWAAYEKAGASTAWLVPAEVPRERLALLGLPYDPTDAAAPVRAELLVHASGDVLAMRVMP